VQRAHGVADRALGVFAVAPHRLDRALDVAQVVERVEDAEHVHAVFGGLVDKAVDHRVFVVAVAQQVLPTQQHLQARIGHQRRKVRSRSHGSSFRKRMQASKVAPPQHSTDQ
jgi:hypothetical protein